MSETDKTLSLLDVRFLEKPAYAVEQSRLVASVMADKSREAMDLAMELLHNFDEAKAEQVAQMETDVDRFEDELGTYLVKLSSKQLSNKDSETLNTILHCIGDLREFPIMPATSRKRHRRCMTSSWYSPRRRRRN